MDVEVIAARFFAKVCKDEVTGCWIWTGSLRRGYGRVCLDRSHWVAAHRLSYQTFKGEIPEGMVIDHLCRNPRCINPDHLEVVTSAENTRRGLSTKRLWAELYRDLYRETHGIGSGEENWKSDAEQRAKKLNMTYRGMFS